jgi:hypothetical protein
MPPEGELIKTVTKEVRETIRKFVKASVSRQLSEKNIQSIRALIKEEHIGDVEIKIGKYLDNRLSDRPDEEVMAIFECDDLFLVCTPLRGVLKDMPYLFGKAGVYKVEYMEE